jgi:hypothetical protein
MSGGGLVEAGGAISEEESRYKTRVISDIEDSGDVHVALVDSHRSLNPTQSMASQYQPKLHAMQCL